MNSSADFGAGFHVYLNPGETAVESSDSTSHSRDSFNYIGEDGKRQHAFATESDLSWSVLRRVLANTPLT
ncbi:hypothetical protein [Streptomyces sp. WMMB 714]|uniref:hypothetical protein n=1 Tax=Streptomyces sp. WMMB 714 TaxID=1286822 RepID=UPI0011130141|nr:hypothetical protein [Streptomyces sp. WMMB 714]